MRITAEPIMVSRGRAHRTPGPAYQAAAWPPPMLPAHAAPDEQENYMPGIATGCGPPSAERGPSALGDTGHGPGRQHGRAGRPPVTLITGGGFGGARPRAPPRAA